MVKENILGLMENIMKDSMSMIKNKGSVSINGLMVNDMKDNGLQENNMEKAKLSPPKENGNLVYGKTVLELNGSLKKHQNKTNDI